MDKDEKLIGNLYGYLLEPISAAYAVSNKYYFDEDHRKDVIGSQYSLPKINLLLLARLKKFFTMKSIPSGLALVDRLADEYKKKNNATLA